LDLATSRVEEARKAYARSRVDSVLKIFGFAVAPPALLAGLASILTIGMFAPAAIGAAVSLFMAQRLSDLDKARADLRKEQFSSVLEVRASMGRAWLRGLKAYWRSGRKA